MIDQETAEAALLSASFRFAKSMPKIPHEYTRRKEWGNDILFEDVVKFIRENGRQERFWSKVYTYYHLDGYKYWTMGAPIAETILINRAKV